MKKLVIIGILILAVFTKLNAQNAELSTLRIGGFTYQMTLREASAITEKPLIEEKKDYGVYKIATYKGGEIQLQFTYYDENTVPSDIKLYSLSTKSPVFKTKSGLGVGSTKEQLLQTYKDYPNFSVGQSWDENGKISTTEGYFSLKDVTAGTNLQFTLKNNVVTEVSIYMDEGE